MSHFGERNLKTFKWIKRLEMVTKVKNYDEITLFKITHLNQRGKAKEWYKKINPALAN
jgi:hypothetical protein